MFQKMTVKFKVYCLAFLGIFFVLSISSGSIYGITEIGKKLKQIAEEDIPLTNSVTQITVHQLEQAILFERAVKYAEIMQKIPSERKYYDEAKKSFLKLAKKVDQEILDAEDFVAKILKYETDHGGSQKIIDEFRHVKKILKEVEIEHTSFDKHVEEVFALFETGRIHAAEKMAHKVEEEEEKLDHKLEDLLLELEHFTADAALEAEHLEIKVEKILMIFSILSVVLFSLIAFFIARGIIRPLFATKDYADELSNGNLEIAQPVHNFQDEIQDMMKSLSVFKENAIEAEALRAQQKEQEIKAEEEKKEAMRNLADSFDSQIGSIISNLAASTLQTQSMAEKMKIIADDTKKSSQTVAAASEESSVNVNTVASAMEEMSASSAEIATQITSASLKSNDTADNAKEANHTVSNLDALVDNIGEVVGSIQDIAEQTNLLALNATIEAARAGDAGKGFAVVADEVKKLASETASKTEEIGGKIAEIQSATKNSVDAMQKIIENVSEIDSSITGISSAVEEQNATTAEITRSVTEASQGAQQVSQTIVEVQSGAEETETSADEVLVTVKEVTQLSENLKTSVDSFLDGIRTG